MGDENYGLRKADRHGIREGDYVETGGRQGGMLAAHLRGFVTGVHLDPYTRECKATIEPENMAPHHQGDFNTIIWPVSDLRIIDEGQSFIILSHRVRDIEEKLGIKVS